MRVIDLFSGIGGFSLGLERAGCRTVQFCEVDPFCRAVIRRHWPHVPIHGDIKTFHPERGSADIVCGGFPCQPFSSASRGRRIGKDDDRFLWPEMYRVISECEPSWVIGENVARLDGMALDQVVADLEAIGYEVAPPFEIPACAVGHDHHRPRLWICGHANRDGEPRRTFDGEVEWLSGDRLDTEQPREPYGIPSRMDRLAALGNSVVPEIPEIIGRAIMHAEALSD